MSATLCATLRSNASRGHRSLLKRAYATAPGAALVGSPPVVVAPRRSIGGTLLGFFLGFGAASAYGYAYLLNEYNAASRAMLASVEELQGSTQKVTSQLSRISTLEADLKSISNNTSTKSDIGSHKASTKALVDGLSEDVLALKQRLWGVEKDLNDVLKSTGARGVVGKPRDV